MRYEDLSEREQRYVRVITELVDQHCEESSGIVDANFIAANAAAIDELVELGIMKYESCDEYFGRGRWARWVKGPG
jgi:hypothetical protein